MRKLLFASALAIAFGVASPKSAAADPITLTLQGVNDSTLTANVLLTYNASLGQLSLAITNTSANYDPRLTGFAFNLPSEVTGISSFTSTPSGWGYSFDRDAIDTPGQFGFYDAAGLTGSDLNGGFPNLGIPIGSTYSFVFTFTGSGLGSLTETSFVTLADDPSGQPDENEQTFIARFQRVGADGEGSDVAIPTTVTSVPEPTTLMLSGLGFLGLASGLRRRNQPKS
jgi:PEP-CTERM motif